MDITSGVETAVFVESDGTQAVNPAVCGTRVV